MSTRIKRTISEWLENSPEVITGFDELLTLSGTYDEETVTIASANDIKMTLNQLWGERAFYVLFTTNETPTDAVILARLAAMYATWKAQQLPDYLRAFYALALEYAPLDNYSGYEKTETTYGKSTDTTYGKSTDTEYGKKIDTTHGKSNTLETDIFGYNSSTESPSDVVTSTDSGTDTDEYSGTDTVTDSGTDTVTDSGKDTVEITKRGNLGLTTSQQMLSSEWNLRKQNFVVDVLRDFVNFYTIY